MRENTNDLENVWPRGVGHIDMYVAALRSILKDWLYYAILKDSNREDVLFDGRVALRLKPVRPSPRVLQAEGIPHEEQLTLANAVDH